MHFLLIFVLQSPKSWAKSAWTKTVLQSVNSDDQHLLWWSKLNSKTQKARRFIPKRPPLMLYFSQKMIFQWSFKNEELNSVRELHIFLQSFSPSSACMCRFQMSLVKHSWYLIGCALKDQWQTRSKFKSFELWAQWLRGGIWVVRNTNGGDAT